LTPEAAKRTAANLERARRSREAAESAQSRSLAERCITWGTVGPPMLPPTYNANLQILQSRDYVVIRHEMIHDDRIIPLDGRPHVGPNIHKLAGDSRGHWEGDTLVVDTVGIQTDAFTQVDRFGTPQSEAMHIVERYRLIDGAVAKAQIDKFETSEGTVGAGARDAGYNPDTSLKGLQLEVTMEDPKVFTAPLTARVTYRRVTTDWEESVCVENPTEHYQGEWIGLPRADHPDF